MVKTRLNSKKNTYMLTQTDPRCRKLERLCSSITEQKWKHQAAGNKSLHRQHKIVALQFTDNDYHRHKLGQDLSLWGKQIGIFDIWARAFETRLSKKIMFLSKTSKSRACSGVKRQNLRSVLDFWIWIQKWKIDPGRWHIPVYPTLGSPPPLGWVAFTDIRNISNYPPFNTKISWQASNIIRHW